jgi:hypothetical protein
MGKRCSLGLSFVALLIAFDPAFSGQIESVTEKDKPLIRKSSPSRPAQRYPWKTSIVTTLFWIGEQPGGNNLVPNRTSAWTNDGQETTAVLMTQILPIGVIISR